MREVVSQLIWLGNAHDVRDPAKHHNHGIAAVIDLALDEPVAVLTRDLIYCRFPLVDGSGNDPNVVRAAIHTSAFFIRTKTPTLIACSSGLSRSPTILALARASIANKSPDDCLREILAEQPADVAPVFWLESKNAFNDIFK